MFLVISDIFYPGWQAAIEGVREKVYLANYSLRGVVVPPGEHKIELSFKPKTLYIGCLISTIALLLSFVIFYWLSRKKN